MAGSDFYTKGVLIMNCEQVPREFYIEGLARLSDNVSQIEYHETAWKYADFVLRQADNTFEARQKLPELAAWREFCADIVAELKDAYAIGLRDFQIELPQCYKLAVALEIGCYRDNPQLRLDTIAELDKATLRLPVTVPPIDYVTLLQCAGFVNKTKRTLERWKQDDTAFPTPEIIGENGEADEWRWATIRPYLETKARRKLPETFPAHIAR